MKCEDWGTKVVLLDNKGLRGFYEREAWNNLVKGVHM